MQHSEAATPSDLRNEWAIAMDAALLSRLIGSIYDCAIDPTLWPSTLEQIALALDSPAAALNVLDIVAGTERTLVYAGVSREYQELYHNHHQGNDLFGHGMLLQPIDQPATSDELVTEAELLGSRMYREWAAPQGFRHVMLTTLMRSQARLAFIGVTRQHDQSRYGAEDKADMALLAPHVRRAVTIADLIGHKSLEHDDLVDALDALKTVVLILGEGGRLVYANAAGRALLDAGILLVVRGGIVEPWDRSEAAALRNIVAGGGTGTVRLVRRDGGHALASALPLGSGRRRSGSGGRVAMFVQDVAAAPNAAEAIGRLYRLTGGELRVMLGLASGETPKSIAQRYGIAPSTVRSHLKSLFAKTGTNRQKDLVKLLFSVPPIHVTSI